MRALPAVARRVSSNPDAYVYLAESIRAWPDQAGLAAVIGAAGWSRVGWRNLTGGIVALHRAIRPIGTTRNWSRDRARPTADLESRPVRTARILAKTDRLGLLGSTLTADRSGDTG